MRKGLPHVPTSGGVAYILIGTGLGPCGVISNNATPVCPSADTHPSIQAYRLHPEASNTLTWWCSAQHSSACLPVEVTKCSKKEKSADVLGQEGVLLCWLKTSPWNLFPALCCSLWLLKIVPYESDVISVFPTTKDWQVCDLGSQI